MKKIVTIITALTMVCLLSACMGTVECDKCDEIEEMQARLVEVKKEFAQINAAYEGSYEYDTKEQEISSLKQQINLLAQHECPRPAENVKGKEYTFGAYDGKYSGEWKCGMPHGQGVFNGVSSSNGSRLEYEGEWIGGTVDGYGVYNFYNAINNTETYYEGDFVSSQFHGSGLMRVTYSYEIYERNGEWQNGKFKNGEYTKTDLKGNLTDYGTIEDGVITYSAKHEAEEKRNEEIRKQQEEALGELAGELAGDFIGWLFE